MDDLCVLSDFAYFPVVDVQKGQTGDGDEAVRGWNARTKQPEAVQTGLGLLVHLPSIHILDLLRVFGGIRNR